MSLSLRPTLRPVVWSDIDIHGHTLRRVRSRSPTSASHYPASPSASSDGSGSDSRSITGSGSGTGTDSHRTTTSSTEYPPRKKKKAIGVPAVYYPPQLSPSETMWRDRYGYLFQRGYQIRPRYQPNWTPTCLGNGRHHHSGEDHIMQILPQVLDGIRRQDGLVVCLKMIQDRRKLKQIAIVEYFSTRRLTGDTRNHVVPFYDSFPDAFQQHIQYMVTPVLRRFDDPEFGMACEVVDFVSQVLEGLVFMHENNVAHHNLTPDHIMMDAKSLIPTGWHFVSHFSEPDGMTRILPLDRKNHPVRYYFIGFGNCYHIAPGQVPLVTDIGGNDDDVPELFSGKAYDPYKLDVYTLGNVLLKELYQKYYNLEFLKDLTAYMRVPAFEKRPTAQKVLSRWYHIRDTLDEDEMDEQVLVYRPGKRPKAVTVVGSEGESPTSSGSGSGRRSDGREGGGERGDERSDKRDIASIVHGDRRGGGGGMRVERDRAEMDRRERERGERERMMLGPASWR